MWEYLVTGDETAISTSVSIKVSKNIFEWLFPYSLAIDLGDERYMEDLKRTLHYNEATEVINMLKGFREVIGVTKDP